MRFEELIELTAREMVFESALLLAGDVDPADVHRQLSRWVKAGKVVQVRRGLYALAEPYRKMAIEPFVVANRIARPSYVSLESALAFHGVIPEAVSIVTSVTGGRPRSYETPLGRYDYRHVRKGLLGGFIRESLRGGATALVATAEKALLDLLYLRPASDAPGFLAELRINPDAIDVRALGRHAKAFRSPKVDRAVSEVIRQLSSEGGFEKL